MDSVEEKVLKINFKAKDYG